MPLATRLKGDVFRILASEDGTRITINGMLAATLQRGKFFETTLTTRSQIETSAPALVAQYSASSSFDGITSDPFMMLIPPTEQFQDRYTFSTPASGITANYVNVVVPSGEVGNLRLDGAAVDTTKFSAIGSSGFSGGQLPISQGAHHMAGNVPFGIHVYGYASYDSYGYPGGMSFKVINPVGDPYAPNVRVVLIGDTIQGTATDSEDVNANGILDAGEDKNGNGVIDRRSEDINGNGKLDAGEDANANGVLDRDTGIFRIEFLPGSTNLKLEVLPFVPGSLAVPFSITRVDRAQPGAGVLVVEDGAGNKRETPIALGAVAVLQNVRVVATLSTAGLEIDPASFSRPPYRISDGPNQRIIEWRFDSVPADSAAALGFDLVLKNPVAGETRLVSHQVDLYYDDINGNPVHTALDAQKVTVHPAIFQVTPVTDKASYGPNEIVQITSTVKNLTAGAGTAAIRLSIQDVNGAPVATLGTLAAQTIPAGGIGSYTGLNFPTGNTYVGGYKVVAEGLDASQAVIAAGTAAFTVGISSQQNAKASLVTDKTSYTALETVRLSGRISNLLTNATLDDVRIVTAVRNPDGSVRFSKTDALAQLTPSAIKDYAYTLPLTGAAAGSYQATLALTKADGTPLAQAATLFAVTSTADSGAGLVGMIAATPSRANMGQMVRLAFAVTNNGNGALNNVPLKISIVDPEKQQVLAEFPDAASLAVGGVHNGAATWLASGDAGGSFVAVLSATIGGKVVTLAQTPFAVLKLDIQQRLANAGSRVLVLVSCNDGENDTNGENGNPAACATGRSQTIDQILNALAVPHTIVTHETAFRQEFRSGAYNTYWISGKQDKLHAGLASEIREAVFAGDGLILDGVHDQRNRTLDTVVGVRYRGKHGYSELTVDIATGLFDAQSLASVGHALTVELAGGTQQAVFNAPRSSTGGPAIVSRAYGAGHALLFAFDLASSLPAQPAWQPVLAKALQTLLVPPPAVFMPGAVLTAKTTLSGQGPATDIHVQSHLPQGVQLVATSPAASFDANSHTASWQFRLAQEQTQDLLMALRLPANAGDYPLQTVVATVHEGVANAYGLPLSVSLPIVSAQQTSATLVTTLNALGFAQKKDQRQRDAVLANVHSGMSAFSQGTAAGFESAIGDFVAAIDRLADLPADTRAIHDGIGRLLKEAQWRWSQLPG